MTLAQSATSAAVMVMGGESAPRSPWREAVHRLTHRPATVACLLIVGFYCFFGFLSFTSALDKKISATVFESYQKPAFSRFDIWLGADIQGRSVIWRLLYGARIALTITVLASVMSLGIGVTLGVLAGYFGGWVDDLITWLFTTVNAVPWILLVLAFVYALKDATLFGHELSALNKVIIALGLTDWVNICRLIRGEVLKHRDRDYVHAARAAGLGTGRILFRHILPNVFHLVIISFSLGAVSYVQAEVVLAFLGVGISDMPSWGRMIDDAKLELLQGVWWQFAAATTAIAILCLALNVLGDALRDALDPRLRGVD